MSIAKSIPVHHIAPRDGWVGGAVLSVEPVGDEANLRPPHRHAFVQVILILSGEGEHHIDFEPVTVRTGDIHIVAPGQVHSWHTKSGLQTRALMFSEDMLDGVGALSDHIRELTLLGAAPLRPDARTFKQVNLLCDAIASCDTPESNSHLLAAVLWESAKGYDEHVSGSGRSSMTREFLKLVLCDPNAGQNVSVIAKQLGVTPGYLSEQVVADTGSTPGRILRTALSREAQRLLGGTDMSAAQISTLLGFSEPSYFSRFFRREVGCTPTEFRELRPSIHTHVRKEQHVG